MVVLRPDLLETTRIWGEIREDDRNNMGISKDASEIERVGRPEKIGEALGRGS